MRGLLDPLWRVAMRIAYRLRLAWWYVRRPEIHGSYVAVWHGERVLIIRNSYRRYLSFPAGGRARGESLLDAAQRELREEVGITVAPADLAYYREFVYEGRYAEDHGHVFELHCASPPAVCVDRREVIWAGFLSPDEALARGVVGIVQMYLESAAQSKPASTPTSSADAQRGEAERS